MGYSGPKYLHDNPRPAPRDPVSCQHLIGQFLGQNDAALFPFPAAPSSPVFCPIMLLVATLLALLASLGLPSTSVGFSVDISSNYCAAMKAYAPAPPLPPWVGGWVP